MSITASDPFKAAPRISEERFGDVLRDRGANPELLRERSTGDYYRAITAYGVDPLFILAMFWHESQFGTKGTARETHSWGNTRTPNFGAESVGMVKGRSGSFPEWRNWLDGCISTVARLVAPDWVYHGRSTIREIFDHPSGQVWAPAGDMNDPHGYLRAVLDFMNMYAEEVLATPLIPGLIDIRSQLQRNMSPGHGPNETRPIGDKDGIIIHYRGVVTDPNHQGISMIQADALYHVSRDWGQGTRGDGLMYHIEIGPNGEKYWCRDLDAVLWHCGSWPENATYWAVSIPIGPGQHATPQQLQAAWEVCDALRAMNDIPRENVKGHQEVSSTTCPGTLMDDFVHPYRAGKDQPVHDGALYIAGNPFGDIPIVLGFRDWFLTVGAARNPSDPIAGGLSVVGYPMAAEVATGYGSSQRFERGVLRWERGVNPPFDIVLSLLSDVKAA